METSRVEVFPVENMTTGNFLEAGMNSRTGQQTNRPKHDRGFTENKINAPIRQAWNINTAAILGHLANYETHHVIHFNTPRSYGFFFYPQRGIFDVIL